MEKYLKILQDIKKEKIDMTKLYFLSCLDLKNEDLAKQQMEYCYDIWIEADLDMDLAKLADIVVENWEDIQNDKITDDEIVEKCIVM